MEERNISHVTEAAVGGAAVIRRGLHERSSCT